MATATTGSETISINGELIQYVTVCPTLATDTTFDFSHVNEDSIVVYENTGIAHNSTVLTSLTSAPVAMAGTVEFKVETTNAQTVDIVIYLYYK